MLEVQPGEINPDEIPKKERPVQDFFIKHAGLVLLGGLATVGASTALMFRSCGNDSSVSTNLVKNPHEVSDKNPNTSSFTTFLDSTDLKSATNTRVLSNFDLRTLLSSDYPEGKNSVEKITVVFNGCKGRKSKKLSTVSGIVFRNSNTHQGFSPRYLAPKHFKKSEDLRTEHIKLVKDKALLKLNSPPMRSGRQAQLFSAYAKLACLGSKPALRNPRIVQDIELIDPQVFESDLNDNDAPNILPPLIFTAFILGGYAFMQKSKKDKDKQ